MSTLTVLKRKDGRKSILLGTRKQLTLPPGEIATFETLPGVRTVVWRTSGQPSLRSTLSYSGGPITL